MEEQQNNYPLGIPPEKPEGGSNRTAIIVLAVVFACVIAIAAAAAVGISAAYRKVGDAITAARTERAQRQQETKPDGDDETALFDPGDTADVEDTADPSGPEDTTGNNDTTDLIDPDDAMNDELSDLLEMLEQDETSDEFWLQIARLYRDDFIEEEVVFPNEELIHTEDHYAVIKAFFPVFEESSAAGVAFLIRFYNHGDEPCTFILDRYQANSWMVEDEDTVEVQPGGSEMVFFYLQRDVMRPILVRDDVKSAGFRLVVREDGENGAENVFEDTFTFFTNGQTSPHHLRVPDGEIVYNDRGVLLVKTDANISTIETNDPYISASFYLRNTNDYPVRVNLQGYINGEYVGQLDTDDSRIVSGNCDVFLLSVAINGAKLKKAGIDITDGIALFEVDTEVKGLTDPGAKDPWTDIMKQTVVIYDKKGKT